MSNKIASNCVNSAEKDGAMPNLNYRLPGSVMLTAKKVLRRTHIVMV
jgi:hypothetical protein